MSYKFPNYLKYADTHEYVKEENGLFKIGVSEFAIDQLGDIVFVELVEKGSNLQKGETFGTIESVKAVEEVYLPFSGVVISVNDEVKFDIKLRALPITLPVDLKNPTTPSKNALNLSTISLNKLLIAVLLDSILQAVFVHARSPSATRLGGI